MKQKDIVELTDKQLKEMILDERINYTKMRLSHSISSHENPMKIKETKKKVARLLTEKKAREIKNKAAEAVKK
jgi:large subunit ribosomal protein L29